MLTTIAKRLVTVIPTLIGVVIVTFLLTRVLPGDPAVYFAGPAATPESIARSGSRSASTAVCRNSSAITSMTWRNGNFGNSLSTGRAGPQPKSPSRLPASAELTLSASSSRW